MRRINNGNGSTLCIIQSNKSESQKTEEEGVSVFACATCGMVFSKEKTTTSILEFHGRWKQRVIAILQTISLDISNIKCEIKHKIIEEEMKLVLLERKMTGKEKREKKRKMVQQKDALDILQESFSSN